MSFRSYMSKEEMASAISALEQALYMHEQWCNHLYCSLICRLPPDERACRRPLIVGARSGSGITLARN